MRTSFQQARFLRNSATMRPAFLPFLVLCLPLTAVFSAPASAKPQPKNTAKSVETLAREVKPSVVKVLQEGREGLDGLGTGFVVGEDGLIATNLHVIGEARRLEVETSDGSKHEVVEITATDAHWDLALLRIKATGLKPLPLADSDGIQQGQSVVAMGNPEGLAFSIVEGVVSAYPDVVKEIPMIRLAMPIERGNSGGPLMDRQGRVLGLLTMKSAVTANLGFAMPVNELKRLMAAPNPVPMERWLTIGVLNPRLWQPALGARWSQRSGIIRSETMGSGFGGRTLCFSKTAPPTDGGPLEVAVNVRLAEESGAAGLLFCAQDEDHHYGFYPSNGKMRLTRFEGADVYSWTVLAEFSTEAYRPGTWNHLRLRVEDDRITGWVNGQKVLTHQDAVLRGGRAGLCRFRSPAADFRGFRIGRDLEEKPLPPELAQAFDQAISGFAQGQVSRDQALEKLLDDPAAARRQLQDTRRSLEKRLNALQDLERDLHRRAVTRDLLAEMAKPEEKIDLMRAALLLARHDHAEVDVAHYLQQVQRLTEELREDPGIQQGTASAIASLNRYLFEENGFHGSRHDYANKSNSYMSALLDDREGLPITLSVLYLELAHRLGVADIFGVPLPGRFMVGWKDGPEGELQLVDVFNRGKILTLTEAALDLSDLGHIPEEALKPASKRDIILRMLRNLLGNAMDEEDAAKNSLPYLDLTVALNPDASMERLTRAQLRQRLGDKAAAKEDVRWLLDHYPESGPEELRSRLDEWLHSLGE
jgi:S1-C subfamily serine protease/regulator of sirC expression with transglutaminase-like and TPR domain